MMDARWIGMGECECKENGGPMVENWGARWDAPSVRLGRVARARSCAWLLEANFSWVRTKWQYYGTYLARVAYDVEAEDEHAHKTGAGVRNSKSGTEKLQGVGIEDYMLFYHLK